MGRASNEKQEFWKFALSEQARSGLSVRKFCLREAEPSFYLWRKKLAQETESGNGHHEAEGHQVFLPVNVLPSQPSKLATAEGRTGTASAMPVLQITTPCGFLINVTHASVTDRIVVAFFAELRLYGFCGSGWGYLPN